MLLAKCKHNQQLDNYDMDQQGKYTTAEILDLSEQYPDSDWDSNTWLSSALDLQKVNAVENRKRDGQGGNNHILGAHVAAEELKMRSELERDLEGDIKDSIYHLALRLHCLYQHRKEKNVKEASQSGNLQGKRYRALSEVNISIKMEGGTKIEIKETKKEASERGRNSKSENVKEVADSGKKFDWAKSLRGGSGLVSMNRTNGSSKQQDRTLSSSRGKSANYTAKGKGKEGEDKKLLQLGWKV